MNLRILSTSFAIVVLAVGMTALAQAVEDPATSTHAVVEESALELVIESEEATSTTGTLYVPPEEIANAQPGRTETATSSQEISPKTKSVEETEDIESQVSALVETYFSSTGKYLQILTDNQLPDSESGSVAEKLGTKIPAHARVNVYQSPEGPGYEIVYENEGTLYSFGFGPEGTDRTYTQRISSVLASTTGSTTSPE